MWRASRTHDGCLASLLRLSLRGAHCHYILGDTQDVHQGSFQRWSNVNPREEELAPVTSFALGIRTQRPKEVDVSEVRPVGLAEIELTVRALPEQEATEPLLAGRADYQVGVGLTPGVEMVRDVFDVKDLSELLDRGPLGRVLQQHRADGIGDLAAGTVTASDVDNH